MNYPVWQTDFPHSFIIALVAVLHVFVSHFAIGGGAFLVLTERRAYQTNDDALLGYVKRHAKFFVLLTLVFGAVSGVGIWFSIGLVSPEATASLIRTFVWGWAMESVLFFVEIASALVYIYNWERLDRATHMIVGWIYFVAAWMSLVVINGILTYMLTPGRWLETKSFWDGFFNPTFFPSLFTRTAICLGLAGLYGLITAMRHESPLREKVVRWSGQWILAGYVLAPLFAWWYFKSLPAFSQEYLLGGLPGGVQHAVRGLFVYPVLLILIALVAALWKPKWMRPAVVALAMGLGLAFMGAFEYAREVVRKPWVINGYMYGNGLRLDAVAQAKENGFSQQAKWMSGDEALRGQELFIAQCSSCHTLNGYRGLAWRTRGWDEEFAAEMLAHLEATKGAMPPFAGDEGDRAALAKYIVSFNDKVELPAISGANAIEAGEQVFNIRCGSCHTTDGRRYPLKVSLEGFSAEDIGGLLFVLPTMNENMPPFLGSDAEAETLSKYLASLNATPE